MNEPEYDLRRDITDQVVAYHEAGHVLAYFEYDIEIDHVTIRSDFEDRWGRTEPAQKVYRPPEILGVIICASPMAEGLQDWRHNRDEHVAQANREEWVLAAAWKNAGQDDHQAMLERGLLEETWQPIALDLVTRRWDDIEIIAKALQDAPDKRLSHHACRSLLQPFD